ncbi:MAG: DUF2267 domain-containing protein [Haloarculaceae archaeon]
MNFDEFVGEVQHRLELGATGPAVRATRATLTTLGERLPPDEADNLASPLPMEIDRYLREAEGGQRFDYDEFLERVSDREGEAVDRSDANYHAQQVVGLLSEVVPGRAVAKLRGMLPEDYDPLFAFVADDATDGG